ncbi:peptidylprolyl isomerase [Solemya pervernicosa gill symbiont]|uniref:Peptidyl-prolyl cis-trans isomerase n=2 Tax=Gammaproteobacteria incertae sedis TaxID=118884 RepID=A0A1T2LAS3_9GAMM|nr:peptidylprolyl isomerase [Candidatus Reidiella endopervernicosa]OOZ42203.1 peptidylprolyl isomerase [Solemya pervernicosa gill symbiont]QKQ27230.1 peptidylprolyl isomerase [Candidatus Reidiella endopervernicosa]
MQIANNMVVSFEYTLTDKEGNVIDSSEGREPLAYIHGTGSIIPGLEKEMEGKSVDHEMKVTVSPEEGYGERDDQAIQDIPRDRFENADEITVGMQFHTQNEQGVQIVTVISTTDESIQVDANHPLAGETLSFDVKIVEVREASQEELDHGHIHGPGGHDHGEEAEG